MVAPYPETDARGVKELRADLKREVVALVPALSSPPQEGEFGHAFYELALRMAAQVTTRLKETAKRDALAFFDALDIPPMAPRAAEAPLVFSLAEKKDERVVVAKGTQVGAETKKGEAIFETLHDLQVTPARLEHLAAVDVGKDTIEEAPANVRSTEQPAGPFPIHRLTTFADAGSTTIQITPAVGLEAGDLIRIGKGGEVYRVEKMQGDLCTIDPKLKTPADPDTKIEIEKVTRFDAFTLRDVQAHQVYIGHSELLNLEQRARITLVIEPVSVMRRLGEMGVSAALWGTPARGQTVGEQIIAATGGEDPKPDWQPLDFEGVTQNGISFIKSWPGKVEKFKVHEKDSLWLRLVHAEKIPNRADTRTRVNTLKLKIQSIADPNAPDLNKIEGSQTINRAFHNSVPLSIGTRFLPFGPEPQRFDTFAVAAPEAFSKKGAKVTLDVRLVDATPLALAMASIVSGPPRAYAVGGNGRLQGIAFTQGAMQWQEIDGPHALPASAQVAGVTPDLHFNASNALQAIQLDSGTATPLDLVVAQDRNGRLWSTTVFKALAPQGFTASTWNLLWSPPDPTRDSLICSLVLRSAAGQLFALILTEKKSQTSAPPNYSSYRVDLAPNGAAGPPHTLSNTGAVFGSKMALVAVQDATWPALPIPTAAGPEVVLIDATGTLRRANIDPTINSIGWTAIGVGPSVLPTVRPAASRGAYGFIIAAAELSSGALFAVLDNGTGFALRTPAFPTGSFFALPRTSVLALPRNIDVGADQPPITAIGTDVAGNLLVALWTHTNHAELTPLPLETLPAVPQGIWVPGQTPASDLPQLVLGGKSESLLTAQLTQKQAVSFAIHDILRLDPPNQQPTFVELDPTLATARLLPAPPPLLQIGNDSLYRLGRTNNLQVNTSYRFFDLKFSFLSGGRAAPNQFNLDIGDVSSTDDTSVPPHFLIILNQVYAITSISGSGPRVATVTPNLPASLAASGIDYKTVQILLNVNLQTRLATAADIATLVELQSTFVGHARSLTVPGGVPAPQLVSAVQSIPWLPLTSAWTTIPASTLGQVEREFALVDVSTQALRGYQNPELAWQYFDGKGWKGLALIEDRTHHLATSDNITFEVPDDLSQTDIGGQNDYWIRADLIGGDYGRAQYIVTATTSGSTTTQAIIVDTSNLHPPEILSIEATFELQEEVAPDLVLVENNGAILNQTQAAAEAQASFELFEGLLAIDDELEPRSIFLGFSKRCDVNPLTLYVDAEEQEGEGALTAFVLAQKGWTPVSVVRDESAALYRRGLVQISMSVAAVRASLFGRDLYWLRLAPKQPGPAEWKPRIKGLYINAVAAEQAKTIVQEILGSSTGEPDQVHLLSEKPVILREAAGVARQGAAALIDVELRVRESLSEEERDTLNATLSRGEIKGVENPPDIPGDWVVWQRVDSFVGQDADARVFRLDPANGTITFGNGRQGKIPPAGRDAIRAFRYQQGGGEQGNVDAYAIKNLKTALQFVETVTNPVEATGGIDPPNIDRLIASAPTRLRNANRALSGADMEALAISSSPDVVRARHIMPLNAKDKMRLAVAIRTGQRYPQPSIARRGALAKYILEHAAGMLEPDALDVVAPQYVPVTVTVELLADSSDQISEVETEARKRLAAFLDPIDGGPEGKGWPFGRRLWPSDIHRIIAAISGVDRVTTVKIEPGKGVDLDRLPASALICAAEDGLKIQVDVGEAA